MSLSLHAGASVDELHRAGRDPERLLIVEVNPALPRTLGIPPEFPHTLSIEEADVIVESDRAPFSSGRSSEHSPRSEDRRECAVRIIESGATHPDRNRRCTR